MDSSQPQDISDVSPQSTQIIEIDKKESKQKLSVIEEDHEVKDYLAKDYESFRSALLQLVSDKLPDWYYKSESDTRMVLLDIFSYVADELSYYQDRVANEAFLRTSTKKFSVSSHLKLLDYKLHNGCSATTFLKINTDEIGFIPKRFQISNESKVGETPIVFEVDKGYKLSPKHNKIKLALNNEEVLQKGSISANLHIDSLDIHKGYYLLFEQNKMKQVVQLTEEPKILTLDANSKNTESTKIAQVTWGLKDYLKFTCNSSTIISANIIRVTQGQTIDKKEILKHGNDQSPNFRFKLKNPGLAFISDSTEAHNATSSLQIWVDGEIWTEIDDLLECGPFEKCFMVEIDDDGFAEIRFGDSRHGRKPFPWSTIEAMYRIGIGSHGNIGEKTLTNFDSEKYPFISHLTNIFPAQGGIETQSLFEAQMLGPKQMRIQERAVTPEDYSNLVKNKFSKVNDAKTRFIFTGSWNTVKISVDLPKTLSKENVLRIIKNYVNQIKMIGHEIQIEFAEFVYPDIDITIYFERGHSSSDIEDRINFVLGNKQDASGNKGFFHPNNFSFGTPVYVSKLFEAIEGISGVDYIVINSFKKFTGSFIETAESNVLTKRNLKQGYIPIAEHQILRLENDPKHPEHGRLVTTFVKMLEQEGKNNE